MCLVCLVGIVSKEDAYESLCDLYSTDFSEVNSCGVSSIIFCVLGSHGEKAQRIALVQLGRYFEWFGDYQEKERILRGVLQLTEDETFQEEFKRLVEFIRNLREELFEVDCIEKKFPLFYAKMRELGYTKLGEKIDKRRKWPRWLPSFIF
jgi:hypothetical protein